MLALILLSNVPWALSECMECKEVKYASLRNIFTETNVVPDWTCSTSGEWHRSFGRPVRAHKFWRTTLQVSKPMMFPSCHYFPGMVVHTSAPLEIPTALRPLETTNMRQGGYFEVDSNRVFCSGLASQQLAVRTVLHPAHPAEPLVSHQERWLSAWAT